MAAQGCDLPSWVVTAMGSHSPLRGEAAERLCWALTSSGKQSQLNSFIGIDEAPSLREIAGIWYFHSSIDWLIIHQLLGVLCVSDNNTNTNLSLFCNKHFANIIWFHLHNKPVRDTFWLPSCRGGVLDDWITFPVSQSKCQNRSLNPGSLSRLRPLNAFVLLFPDDAGRWGKNGEQFEDDWHRIPELQELRD